MERVRAGTTVRLPRVLILLGFLLMIFASTAYGKEFVVKRNVQGYNVDVAINQNPPILGKNEIRVEIRDAQGKPVVESPVTINYFMPPMPGMAPMNYTVIASAAGSGHKATMDLIMQGPWNIVVRSNIAGKLIRMTVLIDVR